MTLILDAFNVLHAWTTGPTGGLWAEISALADVSRRGPWSGLPAILVCDGPSPDRENPELEVLPTVTAVFAGPGKDADSLIERMIEASHTPSRLVVVSSDRRIERAARRRGCRAVSSPEFLRACLGAPRDPSPPATDPDTELPPEEIERWLRAFGAEGQNPRPSPKNDPPSPKASPSRASRDESRLVDNARIDPADLDMERWLRSHPPPKPGVDRRSPSD